MKIADVVMPAIFILGAIAIAQDNYEQALTANLKAILD